MYVTSFELYGSKAYPLALGMIYEGIAGEFGLPNIETLMRSLKSEVTWPNSVDNKLQVYYLENMMESQPDKSVFQIRFTTSTNSRELTSLFISLQQSQALNMSVRFPGRSGRGSFSRMFDKVKSAHHTLRLRPGDLDFEIQGFNETGLVTYIKEHSLTAFVWIEGLGRYLHVKEDPTKVERVRRGRIEL